MPLFIKFPELETERLLLTKFRKKHATEITALANNENISSTTLHIPHPYHKKDALHFIRITENAFAEETGYMFALVLKSTGAFIGGCGLMINKESNIAESGYWSGVPYWNQGYTTEALKEIANFGFNRLGLHKIFAYCFHDNPGSAKVLEKAGFSFEGLLREHLRKNGKYKDLAYYGLLRSEFK